MQKFVLLLAVLILSGCATLRGDRVQERPDFGKYFGDAGVEGTFVLYDLNADRYLVYNPARAETPFIPASTYKIFNSLVALETGVVADENEVLPWDGVERGWSRWDKDQSMRHAIRYSALWFYQKMARRIGEERMQHWVDAAGYGNQNIGGGIDLFWLTGDLRITPVEQVELLVRLYRGDLPFSERSIDIVRDIIVLEETEDYVLRGKTGWANAFTPEVGWFVGYLTTDDGVYFFATNIDILNNKMGEDEKARIGVTKQILRDLKLLPMSEPDATIGG